MERPLAGALFPCDNDNTAFAHWNNGGYFRLSLSFNILPTCSNTYQSSKTLRDSLVLVPSHITDAYDRYEGRKCVLFDGLVSGFK